MNLKTRMSKQVFLVDKGMNEYKDLLVSSSSISKKKSVLIQQQEKYIQKLASWKQSLEIETDHTAKSKFWDKMMNGPQSFPKSKYFSRDKTLEAQQEEPSRKTHLERLRKIRILQERRKTTPVLTPIHGTQIFVAGKSEKPSAPKQNTKGDQVQSWVSTNGIIKSVLHPPPNDGKLRLNRQEIELEKLYLPDNYLHNEVNFPNDIRELLRKTCHYDPPVTSQSHQSSSSNKKPQTGLAFKATTHQDHSADKPTPAPPNSECEDNVKEDITETKSRESSSNRNTTVRVNPRSNSSNASNRVKITTPPKNKMAIKSAPRPTRSSKASSSKSNNKLEYLSSQVIGYRLPPLQGQPVSASSPFVSSPSYLSPIKSPRRQIIVKIPHDVLKV